MLKELTQFIENNTALVIDTDLFAGFRPPEAQVDCTAVYERTGDSRDFDLIDKRTTPIQFITRASDFHAARDAAEAMATLFHGQAGYDLPIITTGEEYHVATSEILSGPAFLGQDELGNFEYTLNMLFRIQDAN